MVVFAVLSLLSKRVRLKVSAAFFNKANREKDIVPSTSVFSNEWNIFASIYKKR